MENEKYNVWVWILCTVVRENYAIWQFCKTFIYWGGGGGGGSQIWGSLKIVWCLCRIRKKMYQIKKTLSPIRDFMNERSLKLTKIFKLNLLIKTESIPISTRPELLPENDLKNHAVGPKPRPGVKLHVWDLGGKGESKRHTAWNLWAVWRCPVIPYVVSLAQSRIWVVNDNRDFLYLFWQNWACCHHWR